MVECGLCGERHYSPDAFQDCMERAARRAEQVAASLAEAYAVPSLPVSRVQHFRAMHMRGET